MAKNRHWDTHLQDSGFQAEKNILARIGKIIYDLCRIDSKLRKKLREISDIGYGLNITISPTYQPGVRVTVHQTVVDEVPSVPITGADKAIMQTMGVIPPPKEVADGSRYGTRIADQCEGAS